VLLALRNLRLGRGDRRGAMRLSIFLLAAGVASNALETGDLTTLTRGPVLVFYVPAFVWLLYIALEPHLRRVWPETMIGWSRMLAGSLRDPLVGRDVLFGVLVAIGAALVLALHTLLRSWSGQPLQFPVGASSNPFDGMAASSDLLLGGRYALSRIIGSVMSIPVWGGTMLPFLLLFVLYAFFRQRALAITAMILRNWNEGVQHVVQQLARQVALPRQRLIASTRSAGTQGFARWRSHPARIALTRSCGRSEPVNAMIGIATVRAPAFSRRATSHPSMSGNPRSSTITFGAQVLASSNASRPVPTDVTS
jgi:hypothetical protein